MSDIDTQIEEILNNHYLLNGGRNLGQYKIEYDCSCGEILLEDGHAQDNTSNIKLVLNTHKAKAIKALLIQQKGGYATPEEAKQSEATKSLTEAREFVASIAQSDTGLGGYLAMNPFIQQSLAYLFLQFANPLGYLEQVTDLATTDHKPSKTSSNPQSKASLKRELE